MPTVFENYITQTVHRPSAKTVELALWDTAGQEEYDRLRPLSYPETDLLFVCFAIDCPASLENVIDKVGLIFLLRMICKLLTIVTKWYPEVLHFCPTTPIILVGLKSDLRGKRTCIELLKTQGLTPITPEQGDAVARRMNASYVECSSKEMRGVDEVFSLAVHTVVSMEEDYNNSRFSSSGPGKTSGGGDGISNTTGPSGPRKGAGKKIKKRTCKIL